MKADDEEQTPVAEFHPHKRHFFVFRMSKHAFFEIRPEPEVLAALEKLIGMFLFFYNYPGIPGSVSICRYSLHGRGTRTEFADFHLCGYSELPAG